MVRVKEMLVVADAVSVVACAAKLMNPSTAVRKIMKANRERAFKFVQGQTLKLGR